MSSGKKSLNRVPAVVSKPLSDGAKCAVMVYNFWDETRGRYHLLLCIQLFFRWFLSIRKLQLLYNRICRSMFILSQLLFQGKLE